MSCVCVCACACLFVCVRPYVHTYVCRSFCLSVYLSVCIYVGMHVYTLVLVRAVVGCSSCGLQYGLRVHATLEVGFHSSAKVLAWNSRDRSLTLHLLPYRFFSAKLNGSRLHETWNSQEWRCYRRLAHLRQGLHDPIKEGGDRTTPFCDLETLHGMLSTTTRSDECTQEILGSGYESFSSTPFAGLGGRSGTTARLRSWCPILRWCTPQC